MDKKFTFKEMVDSSFAPKRYLILMTSNYDNDWEIMGSTAEFSGAEELGNQLRLTFEAPTYLIDTFAGKIYTLDMYTY